MVRIFIPNCRRASSRTLTRFSRRSRRSCNGGWRGWGTRGFHARLQEETSNIQGNGALGVGCWMLDVRSSSLPESDGCLVALAVFKTVVGPFHGSRWVRFLPSPPRQFTIYHL